MVRRSTSLRLAVAVASSVMAPAVQPADGNSQCGTATPPGFTAAGNGWFMPSATQNKSHPGGDDRPNAHPPNGHNNISVECCSYYCLADPLCKGFHVYNPCTWVGDHSNCYVAYTSEFLPHNNPSDLTPAFLRVASSSVPSPPTGWEARCTAPEPKKPPAIFAGHPLRLDSAGNIETWLPPATAHHDLVTQAMAFLDKIGDDPTNGLPLYLTHGQIPLMDYPHNPASLFTQWVDIALRLYAYNGNTSWVEKAEGMLAFHLANGTTPNSSDWAWPGVPYASSDPGDTIYRGSAKGNVTGSGDGVGVIELDKIGGLGLGWLALWKYHGGGDTRREFLHAAAHGARVLARNINSKPTATISPWPFRAFAQSGKTRVSPTGGLGELYTAHVIWNIQLLDAVLAIPGALSAADVADTKRARSVAWEWLVEFPLRNNNWCGYCEDLTIAGLDWCDAATGCGNYNGSHSCQYNGSSACKCDYDSITFRMSARYLMGVPVAGGIVLPSGGAGTDTPVAWEEVVPKMLSWVEATLGQHFEYGARCISEQRDDQDRMSCHTTSYASVLAQYSELLTKRGLNGTLAADAAANAARSWAWSSYCLDSTGNIHVTPGEGESDAWFTVTIDTVLNTLVMMGAMPEPATPPDETHILRSSVVVRQVWYGNGGSELVSYESFDTNSVEKIRIQSNAVATGLAVTVGGAPLPRVRSVLEVEAGGGWALDESTGVLEVARIAGGRVVVSRVR